MAKIFPIKLIKLFKKTRKYPIQRDEYGRSLRQRAFEYFDKGKRPVEVSRMLNMKRETALRYFEDWKKQPKKLQARYDLLRSIFRSHPKLANDIVTVIAREFGMTRKAVIARIHKPWGFHQLLMDKWPNLRLNKEQLIHEARLLAAERFIKFIELKGLSPEEIASEIGNLMKKSAKKKKRGGS